MPKYCVSKAPIFGSSYARYGAGECSPKVVGYGSFSSTIMNTCRTGTGVDAWAGYIAPPPRYSIHANSKPRHEPSTDAFIAVPRKGHIRPNDTAKSLSR